MKEAASQQAAPRQAESRAQAEASAGLQGAAVMPLVYGIEVVDRAADDLLPTQGLHGQPLYTNKMPPCMAESAR
jgi:hypothetical protein